MLRHEVQRNEPGSVLLLGMITVVNVTDLLVLLAAWGACP